MRLGNPLARGAALSALLLWVPPFARLDTCANAGSAEVQASSERKTEIKDENTSDNNCRPR